MKIKKPKRQLLFFLILTIILQSCATTKTVSVDKLSYANIIETINGSLYKAKNTIDSSLYELTSGTVKLYSSGNSSAAAGIALWIIEGGYKWSAESSSSVTYNFSEIKPVEVNVSDQGNATNPINAPKLDNMIESAINSFDSVDAITELKKDGFDLNLKFGITETVEGKFNLDFGIGANLSGSKAKSVAHEITLKFKKKVIEK